MSTIAKYIEKADFQDKNFIGTITFRSEEITLPDGSKMALGIDDGHWVLVYQKSARGNFKVYKYDQREERVIVDQKTGGKAEIAEFNKHLKYFFAQAQVEDLVTLTPGKR